MSEILKIIQILDLCLNFWKGTVFDQFGHCLANSATVESGTVGVNIWSFACWMFISHSECWQCWFGVGSKWLRNAHTESLRFSRWRILVFWKEWENLLRGHRRNSHFRIVKLIRFDQIFWRYYPCVYLILIYTLE